MRFERLKVKRGVSEKLLRVFYFLLLESCSFISGPGKMFSHAVKMHLFELSPSPTGAYSCIGSVDCPSWFAAAGSKALRRGGARRAAEVGCSSPFAALAAERRR